MHLLQAAQPLVFLAFAAIGTAIPFHASAQSHIEVARTGYAVHHDLLGFNQPALAGVVLPDTMTPQWRDPEVRTALMQLHPAYLRFPGGTIADFYDWRTDRADRVIAFPPLRASMNSLHRPKADVQGFLELCRRVNARPVVTFNLFTDSASDQYLWAQELISMGDTTVPDFELGNELNMDSWAPGFAWTGRRPTIEQYLKSAGWLGARLLSEDSAVHVAVDADAPVFVSGLDRSAESFRVGAIWNAAVARAPRFFNAVAMHVYIYHQPNWQASALKRSQWMFEVGDTLPFELARWHKRFFGDSPLWITEFGVTGRDNVEQTLWGFALPEIGAALNLMSHPGPVTMLLKHLAFSRGLGRVTFRYSPDRPVGQRIQWTAAGIAYRWIANAFQEAISVRDVHATGRTFSGHLRYAGKSFPSVVGKELVAPGSVTIFLINRTGQALPAFFPPGKWHILVLAASPTTRVDSVPQATDDVVGGDTRPWLIPAFCLVFARQSG